MLQSVSIIGPTGESLTVPMQDQSTGYYVQEILGLDPVNAAIAASSHGSIDGAQYQSARLETRNIVITLGFSPDYAVIDVAGLRNALYAKILPKAAVTLIFTMESGLQVKATGRVETLESPSFTRDPYAKISVLCFDPNFYALTKTDVDMVTSSNSGTRDSIAYPGLVPAGFKVFLYPNRAVTDLSILLTNSYNEAYTLNFSGDLLANDVVEISTIPGEKGVWLTRSPAAKTSVLYWLNLVETWPRLTPGTNLLRVYLSGVAINCKLQYTAMYGGL